VANLPYLTAGALHGQFLAIARILGILEPDEFEQIVKLLLR